MSERKKQIWLRPDQVALTVACLKYAARRLEENNSLSNGAQIMAANYTHTRIAEILLLLEPI